MHTIVKFIVKFEATINSPYFLEIGKISRATTNSIFKKVLDDCTMVCNKWMLEVDQLQYAQNGISFFVGTTSKNFISDVIFYIIQTTCARALLELATQSIIIIWSLIICHGNI